jgi:hypothetical protein
MSPEPSALLAQRGGLNESNHGIQIMRIMMYAKEEKRIWRLNKATKWQPKERGERVRY